MTSAIAESARGDDICRVCATALRLGAEVFCGALKQFSLFAGNPNAGNKLRNIAIPNRQFAVVTAIGLADCGLTAKTIRHNGLQK
jgi:hypothetical protein